MSHGGNDNNGVFGTALEKYFRVCVKAKKRHEVDLLAHVSFYLKNVFTEFRKVILLMPAVLKIYGNVTVHIFFSFHIFIVMIIILCD